MQARGQGFESLILHTSRIRLVQSGSRVRSGRALVRPGGRVSAVRIRGHPQAGCFEVILGEETGKKFIDKTGRGREKQKSKKELQKSEERSKCCEKSGRTGHEEQEAKKGARGMPWLPEMTKDAVSCENLRGGANDP